MHKELTQIAFLPWADLEKEYKIGPVQFIPVEKFLSDKVFDIPIRQRLEKYFKSYIEQNGNPVGGLSIALFEDKVLEPLSMNEVEQLVSCVDIILFCTSAPQTMAAISSDNYSAAPRSSENFQLIIESFNPGSDFISIKSGHFLNAGDWKIGDIKFPKPWSTGRIGSPDENWIQKINDFIHETKSKEAISRLLRSLEWFRLAHMENESTSMMSKIVMMATAFEIILEIPKKGNKKLPIAKIIDEMVPSRKFKRDVRKDDKTHEFSLAGCWAWDFYRMRNDIVHGEDISPDKFRYKDWIDQLIVADIVFISCILNVIRKKDIEKLLFDSLLNLSYGDAFRVLGWTNDA